MSLAPYTSPLLQTPGVAHGFFTRNGGVSTGIYKSLNCGPGSSDDPAGVAENRARVSRHLLGKDVHINTLYQVHSSSLVLLDKPLGPENRPGADALITKERGLILGVLTADCAPVLLSDPKAGIIAAVHAGWRGALDEVLENVVANMVHLGSDAQNIRAAIGPAIGLESYEVDKDFFDTFLARRAENEIYFKAKQDDKFLFDLERFCADHLKEAGVENIALLGLDTYALEDEFFSYRRACHRAEADYGRQLSAIALG